MSFQTLVTERLADLTAKYNALITNAKRIFELPVQNNLDPASLIHVSRGGVSESLSVQKIMNAVSSGSFDQLLSIGEITLVANVATVPAYAQWKIDEVYYQNTADVVITVPYCATGLERKDILVANTSNNIVLVKGPETSSGITISPNVPINTVFVTDMDVTDSSVGTPSIPIIGDAFVKKLESQDFIANYGATTVIDQINLIDERSSISLVGSATDVKSVQLSGEFIRQGKPHFFKNRTGHNVKLWHLAGTGNIKYFFPNGLDLIVKPNEIIEFSTNANDSGNVRFEYVGNDIVLGFTPENIANKNVANGYAGLDANGKINPLQLPALAITDTFVVNSQVQMLALVVEVGDVAVRTDINKSFILRISGASTLANWQELLTPISVDQSIINGSSNAVSSNAVYNGLLDKEPVLASGVTSQYYRGDKSWQTLNSSVVPELTNLYYTNARGINSVLTGYVSGSGTIASTDTILQAIQKLNGNVSSSTHNPVTLGITNGLSLATQVLSLGLASSGVTGALSGTDWNTFNNKFNTPTGLTTNYLPKWNGSGFVNTSIRQDAQVITAENVVFLVTGGTGDTSLQNSEYRQSRMSSTGNLLESKIVLTATGSNTSFGDMVFKVKTTASSGQYEAYFKDAFFIKGATGNVTFNTSTDNNQGVIQANGNITASPATLSNQVPILSQVVPNTTNSTIDGVKTFTSSPIVPTATLSTQAVNKGQLDAAVGSGTFLPTMGAISNISTISPINGTTKWIKIGNMVTVSGCAAYTCTANINCSFSTTLPFPRTNAGGEQKGSGTFKDVSSVYGSVFVSGSGTDATKFVIEFRSLTNTTGFISYTYTYLTTE